MPEGAPSDPILRERCVAARDGLALYARDYAPRRSGAAAATTVLCLSGLTRNSKDFEDIATRLSARRRVICPDYRGRGRSAYDANWRNYRPETYIDDLLQMLTALDVHRVAVIGTSLGGALGWALAVVRPGLLAGVVSNDIGAEVGVAGIRYVLDYVAKDRPQPDWPSAVAEMRRVFGYLELGEDANWHRMARATYKEGADGKLHFDWDVNLAKPMRRSLGDTPDLWPYFHATCGIPALAIRGGKSEVLSAATLTKMQAANPDLRAVVVPGVGHAPHLGEPEAANALDDFLAAVDAREAA